MKMDRTFFSIQDLLKIVTLEQVKVVSFDLFDTLLVRPSMNPTDIFFLLNEETHKKFNLDFVELRKDAEKKMPKENSNIFEIWEWICTTNNIPKEIGNALLHMEIELEEKLLSVRPEMMEVLVAAHKAGKRVIVTSDMYLGSKILSKFIEEQGINWIEKIYVSCEYNARKSNGQLYKIVSNEENIEDPSEIVHIGDNFDSDFIEALKSGITAIYYPSIWEDAFGENCPFYRIISPSITNDPFARLLLSYSIFYTYTKLRRPIGEEKGFNNISEFVSLYLGNILLILSLDLMNDTIINDKYDEIYFTSRDGYLPKIIFDLISKKCCSNKPTQYFYSSRITMGFLTYSDFFDYFDNIPWKTTFIYYSLQDYINILLIDKELLNHILSELTDEEKSLNISSETDKVRGILLRFKFELNNYYFSQRSLAQNYYKKIFPHKNIRYLVFDCGYSGSISAGLMNIEKDYAFFDKYYIWETEKNKQRDQENGTYTYCLSTNSILSGADLIIEEFFSPPEGSCIGFMKSDNGEVFPILEKSQRFDEEMLKTIELIKTVSEDYSKTFIELFYPFIKGIKVLDRDVILGICTKELLSSPYMEASIFSPIKFTDTLNGGKPIELSKKIFNIFRNTNQAIESLSNTQFCNPDSFITPLSNNEPNILQKICIHFHFCNLKSIKLLFCKLKSFPAQFDLLLTTPYTINKYALRNIFGIIGNVNRIKSIKKQEYKSHVLSWMTITKEFQSGYDLICHLYSSDNDSAKEASTIIMNYCIDLLLYPSNVEDIINLFDANKTLGCLFPSVFIFGDHYLANEYISSPILNHSEMIMMNKILVQLGIDKTMLSIEDLLFPAYGMFWYRPTALYSLFDVKLDEVIHISRMELNAVDQERIIENSIIKSIGIICEQHGFSAKIFSPLRYHYNKLLMQSIHFKDSTTCNTKINAVPQIENTILPPKSLPKKRLPRYFKKLIKAFMPYAVVRIWQKIRYRC